MTWLLEQRFDVGWVPIRSDRSRAVIEAWLTIQDDAGEYRVTEQVDSIEAES